MILGDKNASELIIQNCDFVELETAPSQVSQASIALPGVCSMQKVSSQFTGHILMYCISPDFLLYLQHAFFCHRVPNNKPTRRAFFCSIQEIHSSLKK